MRPIVLCLAFSLSFLTATARIIWEPAVFDPDEGRRTLTVRDVSSNSTSCGSSFPADFACPNSAKCLRLNTNASMIAVLCCPVGQDCFVIEPISCDQSKQNATTNPNSELHAEPTTQLSSCGRACCPMGYTCQAEVCQILPGTLRTSSAILSSTASTATVLPSSSLTLTSSTSSNEATTAPATATSTESGGNDSGSAVKFSGISFAAGFIPGMLIGACLAALLLWLLYRKRVRLSSSYIDKNHCNRDTLTDLGPLSRRPTMMHGRSISEPVVHASSGHRTDFLRTTPQRGTESARMNNSCSVETSAGAIHLSTPRRTPKAVRALWSHSTFLDQTPSTPPTIQPTIQPTMPSHLKRGTLSFSISPVRALKRQKSMNSLRRQMTEISRSSSRKTRPGLSRSESTGSTETIQVLMPSNVPYTPPPLPAFGSFTTRDPINDRHADSVTTWGTSDRSLSSSQTNGALPYASSSRYPTETFTPTPAGRNWTAMEVFLGTPYTPSKDQKKRGTTFTAMMEASGS